MEVNRPSEHLIRAAKDVLDDIDPELSKEIDSLVQEMSPNTSTLGASIDDNLI